MNNILITGAAGFIGSNFVKMLIEKYSSLYNEIVIVDKLTYASNLSYLDLYKDKFKFYQVDINYYNKMNEIIKKYNIDIIFNFAAETHVDNSISNSKNFIHSNYNGVHCLLELCRNNKIYLYHISTDEVFGSAHPGKFFKESDVYNPSSPYSASKAGADLLIKSYNKTYGLNYNISYCTNNYGPNQHKEKFIPTIINSLLNNIKIPVYGEGKNKRNWIYVDDHCEAIWKIFTKGEKNKCYNISGIDEITNVNLIKRILYLMYGLNSQKDFENKVEFITDRLGHDFRYAIDDSKIRKLNWEPKIKINTGLQKTIDYIKNNS
jgi:dTDP-glucose 4,6-dehydratase